MREIKFRAFLKDFEEAGENGMFYDVYPLPNNEIMISFDRDNKYDVTTFDGVELMQYTGVKDKNGVEIYEGDIVHFKGYRIAPFEVGSIKHGKYFFSADDEYECTRYGWYIDKNWGGYTGLNKYCLHDRIDNCEVIGNIYENKELLDEQISKK